MTPLPAGVPSSVLVIDDDPDVAKALALLLERSGIHVVHAPTGAEAQRLMRSTRPEIAIVDLQLPDTSGVSLVRWLVSEGGCGVIVLSGLADELDRVTCLELGADDYVVKPPNPREFVARIVALHRRLAPTSAARRAPGRVPLGVAEADVSARLLHMSDGTIQELTAAEADVLAALADANGRAMSRDALSRAALHRPWRVEDRSIDQLIFQLRRKLGHDDVAQRIIQTVRGEGYRLTAASSGMNNKT